MLLQMAKFHFFKDFIYLVGRERGGSRLPAEQRARCGARSQDPGIMTWAEGRGFNPLSHPGAPKTAFCSGGRYSLITKVVYYGNILDTLVQNKIFNVSAQKMCRDELSPNNTGQYLMLPLEEGSTVTCKDFYQDARNWWTLVCSVNLIATPVS